MNYQHGVVGADLALRPARQRHRLAEGVHREAGRFDDAQVAKASDSTRLAWRSAPNSPSRKVCTCCSWMGEELTG